MTRRAAVIVGVAGIVIVFGLSVVADQVVAHDVCAGVAKIKPNADPARDPSKNPGASASDLSGIRTATYLMWMHPTLADATRGLVSDVQTAKAIGDRQAVGDEPNVGGGDMGAMLMLAMSMQTHLTTAQRECGLPATGIA